MSFWDKFAYFGGICGLVIAIGGIVVMVVTGWTLMLPKMILALILCASLFAKGRRARQQAMAKQKNTNDVKI